VKQHKRRAVLVTGPPRELLLLLDVCSRKKINIEDSLNAKRLAFDGKERQKEETELSIT